MIHIERYFWGHMLTAVGALSIGFAQRGLGLCSMGLIFLGLAWFSIQQKRAWGSESLLLFAMVISAVVGIFLALPSWLMLLSVVASLGAWDLSHFIMRLTSAGRVEFSSGLGREHLLRLGLVELGGLLAGLAALTFHPKVSFWWAMLLVLVVIISLGFLISRIRREIN